VSMCVCRARQGFGTACFGQGFVEGFVDEHRRAGVCVCQDPYRARSRARSRLDLACQVGPSCHDAGSSDASSLEPTSRISWRESASRVREPRHAPPRHSLSSAAAAARRTRAGLRRHAHTPLIHGPLAAAGSRRARGRTDQCGDEDCKRGGRHLREEDAASAQLDDRLDGDEAGEDHREACGAGRLFVPLPARLAPLLPHGSVPSERCASQPLRAHAP